MASNVKYKTTLKNTRLTDINTAIGADGLLRIYSGTQPTNPDTALSGNVLLAELALSATNAFATASGGLMSANTITDDSSANSTGTAAWGTLTDSGGTNRIVDFSVSTTSADLNLNTVSITSGSTVSVTSFTITGGN